jgi:hypothetical protein
VTRPSDVKPVEGEKPGTRFDQYVIHDPLPVMRFTITPEVIAEYSHAIGDGERLHDGAPVAVPSVLAPYLMAVLYRKYPPAQGGIMAENRFEFYKAIRADVETEIVARGRIEATYTKRGRNYVRYSAEFLDADGDLVARAENASTFPDSQEREAS